MGSTYKLLLTLCLVTLSQCYLCEYYMSGTGTYFSYSCTWGCYEYLTIYQIQIQDCPGVQWWQVLLMVLAGICIIGGIAGFIIKRRKNSMRGPPLNY